MGGDDLLKLIEEAHGWNPDRPRFSEADRMRMTINEWAQTVHQNSVDHGFWANGKALTVEGVLMKLALIHSEVSEALELAREPGFLPTATWEIGRVLREGDAPPKPEGFGIELADAIIRIMDLAASQGIDLEECIRRKHEYNKSRPIGHGKRA